MILDFEIDKAELEQARMHDPVLADMGVLNHTTFLMPVRLTVGGLLLFNTSTGILYMAMAADAVGQLPHQGSIRLHPPGMTLLFSMHEDEAAIGVLGSDLTGREPFVDVLHGWESFASKVREFLLEEFPGLREHAQLGSWFRRGDIT